MQLDARAHAVESREMEVKKQAGHLTKMQVELEKKAEKIEVAKIGMPGV